MKYKVLIQALTNHGVHMIVTEFDTLEEAELAVSNARSLHRHGWDYVTTATILNTRPKPSPSEGKDWYFND